MPRPTNLSERYPFREGEGFSEWWERLWYEGVLGDAAYGHTSRIARIRRGKWVAIPPQWRGQNTDKSTIRKRQSKAPRKMQRGAHATRNGMSYPVSKSERPTRQERKHDLKSELDAEGIVV